MRPQQIEVLLRPDSGPLRLGRSASAALVCTLLASGPHLIAGGHSSGAVLAAVFVGTWMVAAALAARRLTTSQLVGLLLIGQVVVHLASGSTGGAGSQGTMLAAHVTGTAISAWLLRRGEDSLWTLAERIGLRACTVTAVEPIVPWRPAAVVIAPNRSRRHTLLTHVIEGRGPPVGFA